MRKLISMFMAAIMILPGVLADTLVTDITSNSSAGVNITATMRPSELVSEGGHTTEECEVSLSVAPNFSITIPKNITMSGSTKRADYTVSVSGDIQGNQHIMIVPDSSFYLHEQNANKSNVSAINASPDGFLWNYEACASSEVKNFYITSNVTAGRWTGNFDFTISYVQRGMLGLEVDYENSVYTRLEEAVGKSIGSDFDIYNMYGGRKRCNVADDGTILAYYGDEDFKEDGSNGQVMVYQPKFYYMVTPVKIEAQETGIGYHLYKGRYYVAETELPGFSIHPAFISPSGEELDYILIGAYEGSIYDVSASSYLVNDEQVADFTSGTGDKFSSIAGVKPASGLSQNLTRANIEKLCQNRGSKWHEETVQVASMEQMLMIIEIGGMNVQNSIGNGVGFGADPNSSLSCSSYTGSTSSLGNATGRASSTNDYSGTVQTATNKTSITYRGVENDWGNIDKLKIGLNVYGNGFMAGGQPYICSNYNFSESKNTDNYIAAGFTICNNDSWILSMGYSETCDWLFIASKVGGDSTNPVGDYHYVTHNLNGYRIAILGGNWLDTSSAGIFFWHLGNSANDRGRSIGSRIICLP